MVEESLNIKIRHWWRNSNTGHVSLETFNSKAPIFKEGAGVYISLFPAAENKRQFFSFWGSALQFHSYHYDTREEGGYQRESDSPIITLRLTKHQIDKIEKNFLDLYHHAENYRWSLYGSFMLGLSNTTNCSGIVAKLLRDAGLRPFVNHFDGGLIRRLTLSPLLSILAIGASVIINFFNHFNVRKIIVSSNLTTLALFTFLYGIGSLVFGVSQLSRRIAVITPDDIYREFGELKKQQELLVAQPAQPPSPVIPSVFSAAKTSNSPHLSAAEPNKTSRSIFTSCSMM